MIEVCELTKRFGRMTAVDRLSFRVLPGRVTGFLGPNGAGKSTTMRMIMGLDRPTSGHVRIGGLRYRELREPLRTVGALLDAGAVYGGRTARAHLRWLARSNRIVERRVDEVIELTGLTAAAGRRVGTFSLGMGQRLGIAAALLGDPRVLLLDEPVNGLDPEGVLWVRSLVRDLAADGRTVLVSSHLMGEAALTVDHLVVIGRGHLLADSGTAEFVDRHTRPCVRVRTPEPERLRDVLTAAGIRVVAADDGSLEADGTGPERVGALIAAHGVPVHEVSRRTATLEEAFLRLTGQSAEHRGRGVATGGSGGADGRAGTGGARGTGAVTGVGRAGRAARTGTEGGGRGGVGGGEA